MISHDEKISVPPRKTSTGVIRSVDKVVDILELLAEESRGLPLTEIARRLGLNVSSVHHLMATLRARGIVTQDDRTKDYRIGYGLVGLVGRFVSGTDLYRAGMGPVEELRSRSIETSYLSVFHGRGLATIISLPGLRPIHVQRIRRIGQQSYHSTASGKLLLAYRSAPEIEEMIATLELSAFTANTISTREGLLVELDGIRRCGYALDNEEDYLGIQCIGVPVFNAVGDCVAAVSIAYPTAPPERTQELIPLVLAAGGQISSNLGASLPSPRV
ncbi:MAG: IclR family transcriptional regulator [Thermomicrobiales bacterium]